MLNLTLARAVCGLLALGAGPAYAQVTYSIADVGVEVHSSYASHLNAAGQFTGYVTLPSTSTAVWWDGATLHTLLPPSSAWSRGHTLNDLGQVVVSSDLGMFIWTAGSYRRIAPPGSAFHPLAMNDAGVIAGYWQTYIRPTNVLPPRAMVWTGSSLEFLAGPFSSAYDVNDSGQIAGSWNTMPPADERPAIWTGLVPKILSFAEGPARGSMTGLNESGQALGSGGYGAVIRWNGASLERLGTLGSWTSAYDINASGQAVGTSAPTSASRGRAVVWNGPEPLDIGAPDDSHGHAINASGTVVGWYAIPPPPEGGSYAYHAFVWDGSVRTLDDAVDPADPLHGAVRLTMAWDINDAGQILVAGHLAGDPSARRTFVLTPTSSNAYGGFLPPVETAPALNVVKAGSAVPLKFRLGGDHGLDVLASGYPRFVPTDCGTGLVNGEPALAPTPGSSGLSYDAARDAYTYVWKTDRAATGTCGRLDLVFDDGSATRSATFRFR